MPTEAAEPVPELVLRPAEDGDMAEVAEVYLAARRAAVPAMPALVHPEDDVRRHVAGLRERREVWVADAGQVVGFLALDREWLDDLYVGPRHQGTGIGSALLDLAKAQRPDGFALWVFAGNHAARGFYRRHGLVELEHTDGSGNEEQAPDVRMAWPGADPVAYLRRQIDDVDAHLASLLERRLALTAAVQAHKPVGGHAGRDADREREIVERMAHLAPGLGPERLQRIVHAIITESLDATDTGSGNTGGNTGGRPAR